MPTRAGYATLAFGVVSLIAGRLFGLFELYIVAAAALALVACAAAWVVLNWRGLSVSRTVTPARLHVGSTSSVTLSLSNRRIIPTPVAQITDEVDGTPRADAHVPPLTRGKVTRASYRVPAEVRGRIALGPMRTRVTDPFALATVLRTSAPDAAVLVLPAYDVVSAPPQPSGRVASKADRSPGRIGAHGEEFSSLRDYVVGDDLRKVHWPSTARSGDLVVRSEHVPEHGDSMVMLDVRSAVATPETFERMVSAATSLLIACFTRGDTVRFKTTAGDDLVAEDQPSFDAILDRLALITQPTSELVEVTQDSNTPAESAVLVLGSSEAFVDDLGARHGIPATTLVVRFVDARSGGDADEPRSATSAAALPSRRMAVVGPDDEFPVLWAALLGRSPLSSGGAPSPSSTASAP